MSYAGPSGARPPKATPRPTSNRRPVASSTDWHQVAIFGAGIALGIAVGAGIALLTAPQDGAESRADIRRYAKRTSRMFGRRSRNAWLDLSDEIRGATDSLRRRRARRAERKALAREAQMELTEA